MIKNIFAVLLISVSLISCGDSRKDYLTKIETLEKELSNDSIKAANVNKVYNLHIAYNGFADKFPNDSLAPVFLFRGGDMCIGLKWKKQAIEFFERVRNEYPDYKRTPDALFLEAFVYEDQVKDLAKAGELYRLFIEKYPQHPYAKDAAALLENLGKSPEDLIREFEAKSGNTVDSVASVAK
jgi:tetratricopeptide (TPR) repeat protein